MAAFWELVALDDLTFSIVLMMVLCGVLIYLAIRHEFEPLLLLPIGFGGLLANLPGTGLLEAQGFLEMVYSAGVASGVFPLLIFLGVGAHTDFGPMLANPRTLLLGAAAQVGIFVTVISAVMLSETPLFDFTLQQAGAIGIIGGADGPTAIFTASVLAPELLGPIAVAAYSYMALVPLIQPPIMRALTTPEERARPMEQLREVSRTERILFPIALLLLVALIVPTAVPLVGMLCLGNLMRECGVVERLADTARNALINIVTILLGLAVGSRLQAETFLNAETMGVLLLGVVAFSIGTASGILLARLMARYSKQSFNPLIGAAGVSAVPMSARVVAREALKSNPNNYLVAHAMGPNVAGVIGSAVAAGVMIKMLGG